MDAIEAVAQLKGAERTAQTLSDAAEGSGVAPLAANARQSDFIAMVDPEQDGCYEAGHWIGWPDEYFEDGGAVHHRYVKADRTIDVTAPEPKDDWKRSSATNLMGGWGLSFRAETPEYYFDSFRMWF